MHLGEWILLALGAVLAGAVNTLAGGGSLLTVPLLILVGLEPNSANATNRVGVLAQSLVSAWTFHKSGHSGLALGGRLLPASVAGAVGGAWLATVISNDAFRQLFGWLMLPIALVLFFHPPVPSRSPAATPRVGLSLHLAFVFIGFYAGLVQAGFGFAALTALVLLGKEDLRHANAVKVGLSAALTATSLAIFAFRLHIDLAAALVVSVASALGGYLGTLGAIRQGERLIRPIVLAACLALAVKMIWV
jgi:uncharacterized membrane protein YfcA